MNHVKKSLFYERTIITHLEFHILVLNKIKTYFICILQKSFKTQSFLLVLNINEFLKIFKLYKNITNRSTFTIQFKSYSINLFSKVMKWTR